VAELFDHIDELRRAGGRVAVATLVNTRGTTPRKEGAKMLVGEGGRVLGSVTIGGCVDAQVIEESEDVLSTMRPRLLEMNLGDEDAWEIGLTCGGTIEVFVEPLALDGSPDVGAHLYDRVREHAKRGGHGAIVTRLDGPGGKLLVLDDGTTEGTLGDAFLDQRFAAEARDAVARGSSRALFLESVRGFVEVIAPPALLLVVGAGHVAMPLTALARVLGYRTVVIDGRPRFATKERFPDVDELKIGIPSELVREYPFVASTALVLVAHDYKYDLPVLKHALGTDVGYIGMLGSSRRGTTMLRHLAEDGVASEALARVHVPIGLDLGARSAPEIALAILAEIQAVRGHGSGGSLSRRAAAAATRTTTGGTPA
jgi:xanthine dehydrogenase accessory factor